VAQFLTEAWLQALTEATNAHDGFRSAIANVDLTLQFEVTDPPEGALGRYYVAVSGGEAVAAAGDAEDADASITSNYETAVAISKGELNTQMAFMTGKIKVGGNMGKIMMHQALLGQFSEAASAVEVEYP
jgi:putative sterol carrier protein